MASLKLRLHAVEEAPRFMHYVEVKTKAKEMKELDLDSRTNDDNQVKPIKRTSTFRLRRKEG